MSTSRRSIFFNDNWQSWNSEPASTLELVRAFHRSLPDYKQTPLIKLDDLANEIGVRSIYLKDESSRFGLPAFKILGASWGTFRAITSRLNLPLDCDLDSIKRSLEERDLKLFAATDGNHGRAVARMGYWLGLPVAIYVPAGIHQSTIDLIESEGARVSRSTGNYDQAVLEAQAAADREDGILVQDFAFGDYVDIPQVSASPHEMNDRQKLTNTQWIVDGYSTMMSEIDEQLGEQQATHIFAPVGVGSFAQAVTSHFRRQGSSTSVIGVEPDNAACLWKSLSLGTSTAIETIPTIMAGLDCGTVSTTAWPILSKGLRASLTVSDFEAHSASLYLRACGISAGPCSGSTVAALRRLSSAERSRLGIDSDSVIILPSTEGARDYDVPLDVATDDVLELTRSLEQINLVNASVGLAPGSVERAFAHYTAAWLEHRDLEYQRIKPTQGCHRVDEVVIGSGSGKFLILNGYRRIKDNPLSGAIEDEKSYGLGAADIETNVAAAMVALAGSKHLSIRSDGTNRRGPAFGERLG
jgi:diaminopropionate ammonia-lyase family